MDGMLAMLLNVSDISANPVLDDFMLVFLLSTLNVGSYIAR
jgi:hypothetical protein